MNERSRVRAFKAASEAFLQEVDHLPLEDAEQRHKRLLKIGSSTGLVIQLPHGYDIPRPDLSYEFLQRARVTIEGIEWLSEKITFEENLGCWALKLSAEYDEKRRARYPTVSNRKFGAKTELANRFVVRQLGSPLTSSQHLDDLCRVHACSNPFHLDVVTHNENVLRGVKARRSVLGQLRINGLEL